MKDILSFDKKSFSLVDGNDKIIYENVIKKYPWIIEKNHKCILSPDSDGFLCGLFMSKYLNWNITGFYDGKVLFLKDGENVRDCIFMDMEIFRNYVRSLGHHMVLYNKKHKPKTWFNFDNCIQPNNMRGYDARGKFRYKYPLGAIHLILGIVGYSMKIDIEKEAICPLLYTDGTFKNLFNYPDNCLSWLNFLCAENEDNPLKKIFFNKHYTTSSLMIALSNFFERLRQVNNGKRGADKIKISDKNGRPVNIISKNGSFSISKEQLNIAERFLIILGDLTGWEYNPDKWTYENLKVYRFSKGSIKPGNKRFNELIEKNPLSWAMTSTLAIEYTLEEPDELPV